MAFSLTKLNKLMKRSTSPVESLTIAIEKGLKGCVIFGIKKGANLAPLSNVNPQIHMSD